MVARDLGLAENQIYAWRRKRQLEGMVSEEQRLKDAEIARLKRDVVRLEKENTFLKKLRRTSRRSRRREVRPDPPPRGRPWGGTYVPPAPGLPQRLH